MTSKEIEFIDLTNKQYENLIKIQAEAYKQVLDICKENINNPEKLKTIDTQISKIDDRIISELEEMKVYNKIFIEAIK